MSGGHLDGLGADAPAALRPDVPILFKTSGLYGWGLKDPHPEWDVALQIRGYPYRYKPRTRARTRGGLQIAPPNEVFVPQFAPMFVPLAALGQAHPARPIVRAGGLRRGGPRWVHRIPANALGHTNSLGRLARQAKYWVNGGMGGRLVLSALTTSDVTADNARHVDHRGNIWSRGCGELPRLKT